jgi:very-short-patch-repair endonuclease
MSRIHYKNFKTITALARDFRKRQTPEENLVWKELRGRRFMGLKFLRQHPVFYRIDKEWVEFFVADFYCRELKLIIEIDGEIHKLRREYDRDRDEKLNSKGLNVIRIENKAVNESPCLPDYLKEQIENFKKVT